MPVSTISLDPDDIIVLPVTAPEAHRIFPQRILNDPECSIETLLKDKTNDA